MVWLYNGTFYLTDDGAENSAVHSGFKNLEIYTNAPSICLDIAQNPLQTPFR